MVDATESIKDVWKHKTPYTIANDTQEIIERYKKTMSSHDYVQLSSANQVQFEANEKAVSAYKMVSGLIFAQSIEEMYLILCLSPKGFRATDRTPASDDTDRNQIYAKHRDRDRVYRE